MSMSGSRRNGRRVVLFTVGLATAVLAAAVTGLWVHRHSMVVDSESIDGGALVSSDGRTVSVMGVLACDWTAWLTAAEQPARVVITLQTAHPGTPSCSGMPGFAVYHAMLRAPLGHRELMDGATDKPVPYFDSRRLLRPGYLPPGYGFRYDAPDASGLLGYEYLAVPRNTEVSCSQLYSAGDADMLVITQASGGTLAWPPRIRPRPVIVRGHRALAIPGRISWSLNDQTIVVAATDAALPMTELIAVADSLGLFRLDPADQVLPADRFQQGRMVGAQVPPDHPDHLIIAIAAGDEPAFAPDQFHPRASCSGCSAQRNARMLA